MLFDEINNDKNMASKPLAERMRPRSTEQLFGQEHLFADNAPLKRFFDSRQFPSMIFWGPPGCGKTTIALMIAEISCYTFYHISAVEAGVKEVRKIIDEAKYNRRNGKLTLLFIDEIHRFSKSQQDALLHAVETGVITLIGATTENPSFEVNSALISRCQVYHLKELDEGAIEKILNHAIANDSILSKYSIEIENIKHIYYMSGGDARNALNALELSFMTAEKPKDGEEATIIITKDMIEQAIQQKTAYYDKKGENHYDIISAFIKSLRGSDPDAAMLYLAKMLDGGEDPKFIARRLVIFASEDIGNADSYAITLATSVFQAVNLIGMPECRINLAQAVTYLASCPKSNASYMAINKAMAIVKQNPNFDVPMHLRNAPTKMMKDEGYGKGYKYPHDFQYNFVKANYFPKNIEPTSLYQPTEHGKEKTFKERLGYFWGLRKKD